MNNTIKILIHLSLQGIKELIDNSGMEIISATESQEAADKVQAVLEV